MIILILNSITLASMVCALVFSLKALRELRRYFEAQSRINDLTDRRLKALEFHRQIQTVYFEVQNRINDLHEQRLTALESHRQEEKLMKRFGVGCAPAIQRACSREEW